MVRFRGRWLPCLLCAFVIAFTFFVFGPVDIFTGNRTELTFGVADFIVPVTLIGFGVLAVLFAVAVAVPERVYPAVLGLYSGIAVMGVAQSLFLNSGASALPSGDMVAQIGIPLIIADTALWIAVPAAAIVLAYKIKSKDTVRTVAILICVILGGMSAVGMVTDIITLHTPAEETDADGNQLEEEQGINYLSAEGMTEVAPGKNTIVFILDRFDVDYYGKVAESDPTFFDGLTGFTYFSDNISYFTATYPSITNLITGYKQDFTRTANELFTDAYANSPFLKTLHDNDYAIRVYTGSYYAYRDATPMRKYIENAALTGHYVVTDYTSLVGQMLMLSVYRYAPSLAKATMPEAWFNFKVVTDVEDNGESVYALDDVKFYQTMQSGLTLQQSDKQNAYIFYHLNGCHAPLYLDENCERVEKSTIAASTKGCFKIIYEYIAELKRLGLYEDATIIITGDHSQGFSDVEGAAPVNGTALFVKPAGKSEEPLAYSSAQVSDENLIPAILESAGIDGTAFGRGYFSVPEGETVERYMVRFKTNSAGVTRCIHFTINGPWVDKDNWTTTSDTEFTDFYK